MGRIIPTIDWLFRETFACRRETRNEMALNSRVAGKAAGLHAAGKAAGRAAGRAAGSRLEGFTKH
jgi:hypothetical protein